MTTCACSNCQFFDDRSKAAAAARTEEAGLCRFNPPLPKDDHDSLWPVVGTSDWCGHFAATVERFMPVAAE